MKKIFILFSLFAFSSCGDVGKALRNEKVKTTDEFLVKKKGPLVLPPDLKEIPAPDTINKQSQSDKDKIKKIIKIPRKNNDSKSKSSSVEKSILEKIR